MHVFPVVSGLACPIKSRSTSRSIPAAANCCAVGVAQPVRAHPGRARAGPVGAEDPTHPSLGQRLPRGRPAQHDETLLGRAIRRPLKPKISSEFGEERPVHRHHPFPPTLADHPNLPASPHPPRPTADRGPQRRAVRRAASATPSRGRGGCPGRSETPQPLPAQGFPAAAAAGAPAGPPAFGDEPGYAPADPDAHEAHWCARRRHRAGRTTPVITANSKSPRTAAMRRFCVAGAAPRRSDNRTTVEPAVRLGWSASPDSRTSPSAAPRPDLHAARRGTAGSSTRHRHMRRTVAGENARDRRCDRN